MTISSSLSLSVIICFFAISGCATARPSAAAGVTATFDKIDSQYQLRPREEPSTLVLNQVENRDYVKFRALVPKATRIVGVITVEGDYQADDEFFTEEAREQGTVKGCDFVVDYASERVVGARAPSANRLYVGASRRRAYFPKSEKWQFTCEVISDSPNAQAAALPPPKKDCSREPRTGTHVAQLECTEQLYSHD